MMTIAEVARAAVIRQLAEAYDHFAEEEQLRTALGEYPEAEGAHRIGLWLLRAYRVETDDPQPKGLE